MLRTNCGVVDVSTDEPLVVQPTSVQALALDLVWATKRRARLRLRVYGDLDMARTNAISVYTRRTAGCW